MLRSHRIEAVLCHAQGSEYLPQVLTLLYDSMVRMSLQGEAQGRLLIKPDMLRIELLADMRNRMLRGLPLGVRDLPRLAGFEMTFASETTAGWWQGHDEVRLRLGELPYRPSARPILLLDTRSGNESAAMDQTYSSAIRWALSSVQGTPLIIVSVDEGTLPEVTEMMSTDAKASISAEAAAKVRAAALDRIEDYLPMTCAELREGGGKLVRCFLSCLALVEGRPEVNYDRHGAGLLRYTAAEYESLILALLHS